MASADTMRLLRDTLPGHFVLNKDGPEESAATREGLDDNQARALVAKLGLPHAGLILRRPRLHAKVAPARAGGLVRIVAGPGYGKTTLIVDFIAGHEGRTAYLALDESDRDPHRFCAYLAASLGLSLCMECDDDPGGRSSEDDLGLGVLKTTARLMELIRDQSGMPTVVALDDLHLVDCSLQVMQVLELIIKGAPPGWIFILSSRRHVPVRLSGIDLGGRLVDLGVRELRLTPGEIAEWAKTARGVSLEPAQVHALWHATRGWPAALAVLSSQSSPAAWPADPQDLERILGRNQVLRDYLESNLRSDLGAEGVAVLLAASLLPKVVFPRDEAFFPTRLEQAEAVLEDCAARGYLVGRAGPRVYKVHPLVRGVAEQQAVQSGNARICFGHAGEHLEAVAELEAAVGYYLRAGRYGDAGRIARALALRELNPTSPWAQRSWLEMTPEPWCACRAREPWLAVIEGKIVQFKGEHERAASLYAEATRVLTARGVKGELVPILLGSAYCVFNQGYWDAALGVLDRCRTVGVRAVDKAEILVSQGNVLAALCRWDEALENWEKALAVAPDSERATLGPRVLLNRLRLFYALGHYRTARVWAAKALAAQRRGSVSRVLALNAASIINCLCGDLATAGRLASECWRATTTRGYGFLEPACLLTRGLISASSGQIPVGVAQMRKAVSMATQIGDAETIFWGEDILGDLCRRNRNPARALEHHEKALALVKEKRLASLERVKAQTAIGMDLMVMGSNEEARSALEEAAGESRQSGLVSALVPALFYLGWLHALEMREHEAARCLGECVRLAAEHEHVHFFSQEARVAAPVLALCERLRAGGFIREKVFPLLSRRLQDYCLELAEGRVYPTEVSLGPPCRSRVSRGPRPTVVDQAELSLIAAVESLTDRERDILEMISLGLSNKVIGARLFITEKTVKSHTNRIFRKLGVSNRLQATLALQDYRRLCPTRTRRGG